MDCVSVALLCRESRARKGTELSEIRAKYGLAKRRCYNQCEACVIKTAGKLTIPPSFAADAVHGVQEVAGSNPVAPTDIS